MIGLFSPSKKMRAKLHLNSKDELKWRRRLCSFSIMIGSRPKKEIFFESCAGLSSAIGTETS